MPKALPRLIHLRKLCESLAMGLGAEIANGMRPLVDLVYPPRCPACGAPVATQGGLCLDCWGEMAFPPLGDGTGEGQSETNTRPVIAATYYTDVSRKLVITFKYGGKISLARLLGQIISSRMPKERGDSTTLLVPVPLHRTRLWQRGFNQAALLASELAKKGHGELVVDGLKRVKRTPSLGGLGREARQAALQNAIIVPKRRSSKVSGCNVVLVDDVLTSGATSDACISALLSAGARSVRIACFARVEEG
ncbi:MAG: ComF family protein [Pseudomonadota bacterium]